MEFTAEIREVTLPAALQLIQNGIATEITETPIRLSVGAGRGGRCGKTFEGGCHGERAVCRDDGPVGLDDPGIGAYRHGLCDARSRPVVCVRGAGRLKERTG